ncbi:MAG: hypothetical protein GX325_09740 [Peptococcaceae bacterium]|nr:hypothetical protein [Peptococcaceae bacterium]
MPYKWLGLTLCIALLYVGLMMAKGAKESPMESFSSIRRQLASGGYVFVPPGDYTLARTIRLKSGTVLEGRRGCSRIIIDDTFQKGPYYPENEFAVSNAGFSQEYDSATADDITIRGLTFVLTKKNKDPIWCLLGMANIKKLVVEDCDFIVQGQGIGGSNIDLYAGCKNVRITNCYIKNDTGAPYGAAVMVRSLNIDGANPHNATEQVVLAHNIIEKNGNDEAIAVWGCTGRVKDVVVQNNSIKTYGRVPDVVLSAFAGEFNDCSAAQTNNVVFDGNTVTADDLRYAIFQVGQDTDTISRLDDVTISNNKIDVKVAASDRSTVIRTIGQDNYTNIKITDNEITNTGRVPIGYGVLGQGLVTDNVINGLFEASIACVDTCHNNTINDNTTGTAIENVAHIRANVINNCLVGVKCFVTGVFNVAENSINMADHGDSMGIMAIDIAGSRPVVYISGNEINTGGHYHAKILIKEEITNWIK